MTALSSAKLPPTDGLTSRNFSNAEVARSHVGAWSGAQHRWRQNIQRVRAAKPRWLSVSLPERRWGCLVTSMKNRSCGARLRLDQLIVGWLRTAVPTKAFGQSLVSSWFAGCVAKASLSESLPLPWTLPNPEVPRLWKHIQSIQSLRAIGSWALLLRSKQQGFARSGGLVLGGTFFNSGLHR